jgi:hypothetical protein
MPETQKTAHRKTAGYAVCIHSCVKHGCLNIKKQLLWRRDGCSLRRHATNKNLHPDCSSSCPGFDILNKDKGSFLYSRAPTEEDRICAAKILKDFKSNVMLIDDEDDDNDDVNNIPGPSIAPHTNIGTRSNTPSSISTRIIDLPDIHSKSTLSTGIQQSLPATKCFTIVYIPDPTRKAIKSKAEGNLAFLQTSISVEEYECLKHLEGSIHFKRNMTSRSKGKCIVVMQEWVSISFY